MEESASIRLSRETLPVMRNIALLGAVKRAILSLLAWGGINLVAWCLLGGETREFLARLSHPSAGIYFLMYGGAVIGATLLAFAALGAITRMSFIVILDGLALIGIGIFNITNDFIAMAALRPHGYTVEEPSIFWVMLGVCQLIWGGRELKRFGTIAAWPRTKVNSHEREAVKEVLGDLIQKPEDMEVGRIKGSITIQGPLGLDLLSRTVQYSGLLCEDCVLLVSSGIDDCFCIDKDSASAATYSPGGVMSVTTGDGKRTLILGPVSILALKQWAGVGVTGPDLQFLAKEKRATIPLLQPFLDRGGAPLRASAVEALGSVADPSARQTVVSFLDDPEPAVQAAALDAARMLNEENVQDRALGSITNPDPRVRAAGARYLATFPVPGIRANVDQAVAVEQDKTVRKELKKAAKAAARQR